MPTISQHTHLYVVSDELFVSFAIIILGAAGDVVIDEGIGGEGDMDGVTMVVGRTGVVVVVARSGDSGFAAAAAAVDDDEGVVAAANGTGCSLLLVLSSDR